MAVRFECTERIEAPIERVFDVALSVDAHADSMTKYEEMAVAGTTNGLIQLGEDVTWRARHFGVWWTMTSRITELDRPNSFVDEQVSGPFARYRHEHRFTKVAGGTRMVDSVSFEAPFGPAGLLVERVLLKRYVRNLIEERNVYLKAEAERGP